MRRSVTDAERESIAANLLRHVQFLHNLRERTGRTITLALEPEPACVIETSSDVIQFFRDYVFRGPAFEALGEGAREIVHRHLGVCYDACHLAVQYEEPGQVLEAFDAAGIRVLKAQLSAGLRVDAPDRAAMREALQPFADPVYLHQVVERREDGYRRYVDLPDALRATTEGALEWRIHYHVPIYREALEPFTSTQAHLKALLGALASRSEHPMLEVETYTWDVLPARERLGDVVASMTRELNWVMEQLP